MRLMYTVTCLHPLQAVVLPCTLEYRIEQDFPGGTVGRHLPANAGGSIDV